MQHTGKNESTCFAEATGSQKRKTDQQTIFSEGSKTYFKMKNISVQNLCWGRALLPSESLKNIQAKCGLASWSTGAQPFFLSSLHYLA